MADPAKIPERHVFLTPGRMKIGESACFEAEAMRVDIEGYGYIDPYIKRSQEAWEKLTTRSTRDHILLERVEGGFRVDLTKCREPWSPSDKPEPKYGTDWIPVVEFVTDAGQP